MRHHSHEARASIIRTFITRWREQVGPDIYPAFRLILPAQDRDRPMYGLKEKALARLLVKAMRIDKNSTDAQGMLDWKLPSHAGAAGDFPGRCHEALSKRSRRTDVGDMRVDEVNTLLDQLAVTQGEKEQLPIINTFYGRMNPDELLWLIRIILRQMKIGATEKTMFNVWHKDADSLYSVTSSLRRVCWELHDKGRELDMEETQIELMQCFVPQLAQYQKPFKVMLDKMGCTSEDPTFWIEEKLDGERMQLHMEPDPSLPGGKRFKFWSRKGKDYTYLYGDSLSESGSALTCHLKDAFDSDVDSIILDGEMITWDPDQDAMVPFGTLKTAAIAEQESPGHNDGPRPLYRVFDCLYVNGKCLASYRLSQRRKALNAAVPNPPSRRLEIHPYQEANDAGAIEPLLRRVVEEASEGLVLKSPHSAYRPNERNNDWFKVKPEYMEEFGEDLDCVVIGGYYGSGKRGGILSSYLCGLRVDGTTDPIRCRSFFKVGGGFARSDYQAMRHHTEGKWRKWDRKKPPREHIELGGGDKQYEQPDVWIPAEDSIVLAVKAAAVTMTDQFRTNFTLRFPRFKALRTDKDPRQALTLREFQQLRRKAEGEHEQRAFELMNQRKKKGADRKRKAPLELMGNKGAGKAAYAGQTTSVLEGLTVFVMGEQVQPTRRSKAAIENMVKANCGRIIQTHDAVPGTVCIADKNLVKVAGLRKAGNVDIVRPQWLYDCVAQALADGPDAPRFLIPFEPWHILFATEESEPFVRENADAYGDSFARDVGPEELRGILDKMELPKDSVTADTFRAQLASRGRSIGGNTQAEALQGLVLHFAPSSTSTTSSDVPMHGTADSSPATATFEPRQRMVRATAAFAGASVVTNLAADARITHVVVGTLGTAATPDAVQAEERARRREMAKAVRREIAGWDGPVPRVVAVEWVERCWVEKTPLAEEGFAIM